MRINQNLDETLQELLYWYTEIGIDVAVSDQPTNHFKTQISAQKPSTLREASPRDYEPREIRKEPPIPPSKIMNQSSRDAAARCQTLVELKQALIDFEGCALKLTATNLVFADGNPQAKVMLVGEAPGADEDRQGVPFVGISGQLLDKMLAAIGLDRTSVYITNIVPWRPPGNRQPTTQEIALCQPFVERHIELVNPEILILVGGVSAKTLLNSNEGIMKLRGKWRAYESSGLPHPIKLLATFHPAYLLRSPGQKAQSWQDFLMVRKALDEMK